MAFCLLPKYRDAFKEALKKGEITPEKLNAMTTAERSAFFAERFGGEANGKAIERALEAKYLTKNVETGMVRWAEKLIDVPKEYKTDLVSRIRKMSQEGGLLDMKNRETLLDEIVEYRTGKKISPEEAKTITEMSARLAEAEAKWKSEDTTEANLDYGSKLVAYESYVSSLESAAGKREFFTFMREEGLLGKTGGAASDVLNLAKNLNQVSRQVKATFDNSFFFRQFRKAWRPGSAGFALKELVKAIGNTLATLGGGKNAGEKIVAGVKAEAWSRPNAKNGRYFTKEGPLDLGRLKEETTPETFLEDIPVIG
ncbi:MAG: hypothetical protein M0R06_06280, partial [Sphaerochaeta sp.]|nr:hypothetical protein [Sphaerochaeta sp.]